jgi:hypothetical protein
MFWKVISEQRGTVPEVEQIDGRFVLHRHVDALGPHLDLRLEQNGCLVGWRIEGDSLAGEPWATKKAPHPISWLERDGDAFQVDAGVYTWQVYDPDRRVVVLRGRDGVRQLRIEHELTVPVSMVRTVWDAIGMTGTRPEEAGRLIVDGACARRRAVERLCGLGRELDGTAFDDGVWRRALASLSLDEIHSQLRTFEVRFDQKYPPSPVSRPARLSETDPADSAGSKRVEGAMAIARE